MDARIATVALTVDAFLKDPSLFSAREGFREGIALLGARFIDVRGSSPQMSIGVF